MKRKKKNKISEKSRSGEAMDKGLEVPYPVVLSKKEKKSLFGKIFGYFQETRNNHALWRSSVADATLLQIFERYVDKEAQVHSSRKHHSGGKL